MAVTINGTTGITTPEVALDNSAADGGQVVLKSSGYGTWNLDNYSGRLRGYYNSTEYFTVDASGNMGIGTSSPVGKLQINTTSADCDVRVTATTSGVAAFSVIGYNSSTTISGSNGGATLTLWNKDATANTYSAIESTDASGSLTNKISFVNASDANNEGYMVFQTRPSGGALTERARITSGGDLLVNKTAANTGTVGLQFVVADNKLATGAASGPSALFNRNTDDGVIVQIAQDGTVEGTISVSGTTVSYNGGNLARFAQITVPKDETNLLKGTVLSNLDEMNVYTDDEGNPVANEQLNKVKVSDVEGDVNVAGVFVNWTHDDAHEVDEINMAMTGDMIIRIAQGIVVQKGDLLMSAGDGTAKPQGDDIRRSKTIAKVTSNHVTCTYADGSYCVPCVLMAC